MTVNTFLSNDGKIHLFSDPELLSRLWMAAASLSPNKLGFTPDQIWLHSARSGPVMAIYLVRVPVFTIILLNRWSSDAFLRYIRKHIHEFSTGISSKMIQNGRFYMLPAASNNDARIPNHPLNTDSHNTSGLDFKDAIRPLIRVFQWITLTNFHLSFYHSIIGFSLDDCHFSLIIALIFKG